MENSSSQIDTHFQSLLARKIYINDRIYELKGEMEEIAKNVKRFTFELLHDGKSTKDLHQLREYRNEINKAERKTMKKNSYISGDTVVITCLGCNNQYHIRGKSIICPECYAKPLSDQDLERIKFIVSRTAYIREYITELVRTKKQVEFKIQKFTYKSLNNPKYFQASL